MTHSLYRCKVVRFYLFIYLKSAFFKAEKRKRNSTLPLKKKNKSYFGLISIKTSSAAGNSDDWEKMNERAVLVCRSLERWKITHSDQQRCSGKGRHLYQLLKTTEIDFYKFKIWKGFCIIMLSLWGGG